MEVAEEDMELQEEIVERRCVGVFLLLECVWG